MEILLENGLTVNADIIKDLENYRGFYVMIKNLAVKATFNTSGLDVKYSNGFTFDGNIVQYLYSKLEKGETLTKNEKEAFYEKVSLTDPVVQLAGKFYDFKKVLFKLKMIPFYSLKRKLNKREIEVFNNISFLGSSFDLSHL